MSTLHAAYNPVGCSAGPVTLFGRVDAAFLALGPNIVDYVSNGFNNVTNGKILTVRASQG